MIEKNEHMTLEEIYDLMSDIRVSLYHLKDKLPIANSFNDLYKKVEDLSSDFAWQCLYNIAERNENNEE